jgi:hypothetical protein
MASKSGVKKKKRKSAQKDHGVAVTDKGKVSRELEYLKNMMKEHFRFFDNNSPELKKKTRTGSHSPPKKQTVPAHNKSMKVKLSVFMYGLD